MYEVEFKHAYCYTKRSVRRSTFNEMFGPLVQVQIRAVMREKRTKFADSLTKGSFRQNDRNTH